MGKNEQILKFKYKNWKGETRTREVKPVEIWFGSTKWHPKRQWFMKALDVEKNEERDFAANDILKFL